VLEIPPLPANTILLVEVGSTAHGTGIPGGEDHDEMGVVVEAPEAILGLDERGFRTVMQRTQPEGSRSGPGDIDRTLYALRRFLRHAASGNPSILMAMWAPVLNTTELGEELRALADAFVGRHIVPRYRGYMQSQAQRLLGSRGGGHGTRGSGRREELISTFGYDTKYAMHCARLGFQCIELLETGRLTLPIDRPEADWLRAVRRGEVSFDEWWARVLALDERLAALETDDAIRPGPDRARIESWSTYAHLHVWRSASLETG
jgi:predicted nucleotidyltransferase